MITWQVRAVTGAAPRLLIEVVSIYYLPIVNTTPQAWGPYANTTAVLPVGASIGIADTCGGDFYSVITPTNAAPTGSTAVVLA